MNKAILPLSLLVVVAFLFLTQGELTGNVLSDSPYPYSATAVVEEQGRTHQFNAYSDGSKTILTGTFNLGGDYPGGLLYNGNQSILFRPNQALSYPDPDEILYGYLPTHALKNHEVTILETDRHGLPTKYSIRDRSGKKSVVTLKNTIHRTENREFTLPENTEIRQADNFLSVS